MFNMGALASLYKGTQVPLYNDGIAADEKMENEGESCYHKSLRIA